LDNFIGKNFEKYHKALKNVLETGELLSKRINTIDWIIS
jgi:hypothetical protein